MIESLHLIATIYMCGLIWFVQLVHYPMFAHVGPNHFREYEAIHNRLTSIAVMPAMLIELGTAILLAIQNPSPLYIIGVTLVGLIWLSTFTLSVPCHTRLLKGFDAKTHRKLVTTNWFRTLGWSIRAGLFAFAI